MVFKYFAILDLEIYWKLIAFTAEKVTVPTEMHRR